MEPNEIEPIKGSNELLSMCTQHPEMAGYLLLLNYINTGSIDLKQNASQPRELSHG